MEPMPHDFSPEISDDGDIRRVTAIAVTPDGKKIPLSLGYRKPQSAAMDDKLRFAMWQSKWLYEHGEVEVQP